jgi:mono/diheme cytochrome c family protein
MHRLHFILCALALSGVVQAQSANTEAPDFTRDIQPILAKSCYGCHGAKAQLGGLRLDSRKLALQGGQSGGTIVPGDHSKSTLYQRIAGIGDQARMPMGGKPLDGSQIDLIKKWLDAGAAWPESGDDAKAEIKKHWAFIPPKRPEPPAVKKVDWSRTPVDRFILAKLENEGLAPSPEAAKATLLRRLSLDLIGLPPTPAELDAFLKDTSPDAYKKQVDRLLASPHYGEKWARMWLDAARYADSDGYEKDKSRQVWFYRDYVINAFNRDLPYDRFIIEQIAGDLLPNADQDKRVATGFLRNSMVNEEGGIDPEQFRMEAMFDRMDAVGKGILGVTIQCSQCHNHKFDPIKQEEYYRLFAFLNNAHESNIAVYTKDEQQKREAIFKKVSTTEAKLRARMPDWKKQIAKWEAESAKAVGDWTTIRPEVDDISTGGQKYLPMEDGSMLAAGYAPTKHKVKLSVKLDKPVNAIRLELLNDPNLPLGGPGRSTKGTGALTEFEVEAAPADAPEKSYTICIKKATADVNPAEAEIEPMHDDKTGRRRVTGPIEYAIDGKDETAWGHDIGPERRNEPRKAVFQLEQPVPAGHILIIHLSQRHGGWNSDANMNLNLGRFRLSVTSADGAVADPVPVKVRAILAIAPAKRTPEQWEKVFSYWRTTRPEWKAQNDDLETALAGLPEGSSQLVLAERSQTRPTHLLSRGDFLKPAHKVEPGVPAFLHPMPESSEPPRLRFAKWLVDRGSPTTARSMVNRVWQAYFGAGLVPSSEDLGTQSEAPSHPELLDWLAVEFMDKGWSLKQLHRTIVESAVYRQSSQVTPELLQRDPYNKLLARAPRIRVEAEVVRDVALAAGGLLSTKVGGPSVFPPAPEFLFQPPASYGPKIWNTEQGEDRYRRALYTFRYRSVPYPMLQNFDAPNGDFACVRRPRSNTPLQALTTLNEPLFLEAARALAARTLREGGNSDGERLNYAWKVVVGRTPEEAERAELLSLLDRQRTRFAQGESAQAVLAKQALSLPPNATPADAAAWTVVSRVLLNLDEAITKE